MPKRSSKEVVEDVKMRLVDAQKYIKEAINTCNEAIKNMPEEEAK